MQGGSEFSTDKHVWPSIDDAKPKPPARRKHKGNKTYTWRVVAHGGRGCPGMVWQFAKDEGTAVEMILSKYTALAENWEHGMNFQISDKAACFGVVMIGPFSRGERMEDLKEQLDREPDQICNTNTGSGIATALDG